MGLLTEAVNESAYLKAGILGFAGAGKTRTATEIAIGLSRDVGDGRPVAFFDTEAGSDYLIPIFNKAGVKLMRVKTRAFRDLMTFMREAEQSCSVAIIDSITHVWKELQAAYKKRKQIRELSFKDWGPLKEEWQQFTDAYLNSRMHVILCGRAGYEYDFEEDERGKKELVKTGIKMKAEGEMGHEPSLLLEMERLSNDDLHGFTHRCHVLKDRTDTMNGRHFDNPTYESFRPFIATLNIGGAHLGIDASRTSEDMFDSRDFSAVERRRQIEILGEKIKEAIVLADLDGTSAAAKKRRTEVLIEAFGTSSWTQITERMPPGKLELGLDRLRSMLALDKNKEPPGTPSSSVSTGDSRSDRDSSDPALDGQALAVE